MIPEQLKDIRGIKEYLPGKAGWGYIYFIIKKDKVVYVGQTISGISLRLSQFRKNKKTKYDKVYHIIYPIGTLAKKEQEYIIKFKPIYNVKNNRL